jgi:transcriptional regulator with XRE-family HTH domain
MSEPGRDDAVGARELGALLRARRARLSPAAVGLPEGRRRRTPGLRREEVALLSAISPTYYALLEQGRGRHPSRQVLDALAAALRLNDAERSYLHALAAAEAAAPPQPAREEEVLGDGVADLVERLDPHPTYITGRRFDVLAANRAARALWTDWPARPPAERNLLLWMFTPQAREVFVEWEREAAAALARFRAAVARHLDDPVFGELVDRLHEISPEVRAWWPRHDIAPLGGGAKRLRHPELGELVLRHIVLLLADEPEHKLVTFAPEPADADRLARLIGR